MGEPRSDSSVSTLSRYRYLKDLAKGGMGTVEIAIREEGAFRRVYAVKRLREAYLDDPAVRAMFLDEGRIAGLISHPNVVSVIDVGEDERGPFLVMDFVRGVSLSRIIAWAAEHEELLPIQLCLRILRDVAAGLHAAHELCGHDGSLLGVVHRDVSPHNVLVAFDGSVRVTDFGIAKALGRLQQTSTGVFKGKFAYMSPEQVRLQTLDRRSDIFSLGIVAFELLGSVRLYGGGEASDIVKRIVEEPAPDIGELRGDAPPEVVDLLVRMLAKDPGDRPADADQITRRLDEVIAGLVVAEGALSVGDFMLEHFSDLRDAQQRDLEALTAPLPRPGEKLVSMEVPVSEETTRLLARRARRRNAIVLATAAAAVALGGLATFWSLSRSDVPAVSVPPESSASPPGRAAEPEPASMEDAPAVEGEARLAEGTTDAPPQPAVEDEGEIARRSSVRRPRRRRPAPRMSGTSTGPASTGMTAEMASELWQDFEPRRR